VGYLLCRLDPDLETPAHHDVPAETAAPDDETGRGPATYFGHTYFE